MATIITRAGKGRPLTNAEIDHNWQVLARALGVALDLGTLADWVVIAGDIDCSANPNFPAADKGNIYRVTVEGKIGGASGLDVGLNDILLCVEDGSPAGNLATVGDNWSVLRNRDADRFIPEGELAFGGTGDGLVSDPTLTYDPATGAFVLIPGSGATPAAVSLSAQDSTGAATGGAVVIEAGASPLGTGGAATLEGGGGHTAGGALTLAAGNADAGTGGAVSITSGAGTTSALRGALTIDGGNVVITANGSSKSLSINSSRGGQVALTNNVAAIGNTVTATGDVAVKMRGLGDGSVSAGAPVSMENETDSSHVKIGADDSAEIKTGGTVQIKVTRAGVLSGGVIDTDGTLAANSDNKLATQKAVKTYADQLLAANDAMIFKGVIDASSNPNYPAADRGHTYRISVAGKIGGASGTNVEVGDIIICLTDGTSSGTQAGVGSSWTITQTNLDGAVIGPSSVTDSNFAQFDGVTGKLIKGGLSLDTSTALGTSDVKVPSQKAVKTYVDALTSASSAVVDTIANLKLVASPNASYVYVVQGYYAANDGGGGLYYWNSTSTATDNGGTVIKVTAIATGRFLLEHFGGNVSLRQFGAKLDGSTNDTTAVNAAIQAAAGGKFTLVGESATCALGTKSSAAGIFDFSPTGFRFEGRGLTFSLATSGAVAPVGFLMRNPVDTIVRGVKWTDAGVNLDTSTGGPTGLIAFQTYAESTGESGRLLIENCETDGACIFFQGYGDTNAVTTGGHVVRNVRIRACKAKDTFYGITPQNLAVQDLEAELYCFRVGRGYLGPGARNHKIRLTMEHDGSSLPTANSACIVGADYIDLKDVDVEITFKGNTSKWDRGITVSPKGPLVSRTAACRGMRLRVNTSGVTTFGSFIPFGFIAYDASNVQTTTTSDVATDLHLDGDLDNYTANPFYWYTTQAAAGNLYLGPGVHRFFTDGISVYPADVPGFVTRQARRGALVYMSADQSLNSGSEDVLLFDSEAYDTDSLHSTASNKGRFTIPAGVTSWKIRLSASVRWDSSAAGLRRFSRFNKNGSAFIGNGGYDTYAPAVSSPVIYTLQSAVVACTAGDYFELSSEQESGGALNVKADGGARTWFCIEIIP